MPITHDMFARCTEEELQEFVFDGDLPYKNRLFFIQHLLPYLYFRESCRGKKVLEIGIGDGFGSYYLSKVAARVYSFDLDPRTWPNLKRYIKRYNRSNISFTRGNGCALPFKDATFDRIITCQVIEHIPEDHLEVFVRELHRVLKPDGALLVSTMNVRHNVKDPRTYVKFEEHDKEFDAPELKALLGSFFPSVQMQGIKKTSKHMLYLRLKKLGLQKCPGLKKPVNRFYDAITADDYLMTPRITRNCFDLYAVCRKQKQA